jgi:Zn-dependent protease/CBS domain-containing protein
VSSIPSSQHDGARGPNERARPPGDINPGFRIGSIAGIDINVDWSLLVIFLLVTFSLGGGVFPTWHPDWGVGLSWLTAAIAAALLLASILVHELSHAIVGRAQGIPIRRITLFVFGGMAHLEREPHTWSAELLMAIVGPITSFVIGIACLFAGGFALGGVEATPDNAIEVLSRAGPFATILLWLGPVNIVLALFNLVPGFPLDGGRVLRAALWGATGDLYRATRWAAGLGRVFGWLLIAAGFAMVLGFNVPFFGTGLVGGLWIALIGWFLNNAALMSYQTLLAKRSLRDVPVSRVMVSNFVSVAPDLTVTTLVEDYLLRSEQHTFPVIEGGRLAGVVSLEDVRKTDPARRDTLRVSDIMTPATQLATVTPEEDVSESLRFLSHRSVNQLPVVEDGEVRGILRREDVLKWLALRGGEAAAS